MFTLDTGSPQYAALKLLNCTFGLCIYLFFTIILFKNGNIFQPIYTDIQTKHIALKIILIPLLIWFISSTVYHLFGHRIMQLIYSILQITGLNNNIYVNYLFGQLVYVKELLL